MMGNEFTVQTSPLISFFISFAQQNLSMLRFPYGKICYLFPLAEEQSTPEKLMRDLEKAKQVRKQMYFKTGFANNATQIRENTYTKTYFLSAELSPCGPTVLHFKFTIHYILNLIVKHYLQVTFLPLLPTIVVLVYPYLRYCVSVCFSVNFRRMLKYPELALQ